MGKIEDQPQIQETGIETSTSSRECCCSTRLLGVRRVFTFRCIAVLILGAGVFLSAAFWLRPFHSTESGFDAGFVAPVQASFRLQRPVSLLTAYTSELESEILDEIGMPNTKVSIISMHPLDPSNWTNVVFGVLPDQHDFPITPVALSVIRSSLVELVLQHWNLSLTWSIFGQPSSFEVLKFPGGITVVPTQPASILLKPQILFNFTLNNSVSQIQQNLAQLKGQLKYGLQLRSYESIHIKVTNLEGSTVAPPVIVQSTVLSASQLLPERLKQLTKAITGSPMKNLGLDHSIFGKVKQIRLSQCLENSLGSPSPSPCPSPSGENAFSSPPNSQYPEIVPSHAPAPSADHYRISPCPHCNASPPSFSRFPPVSTPQNEPRPPSAPPLGSPAPPVVTVAHSPRHSPCAGPTISPKPVPKFHSDAPTSSYFSPRSAVAPGQVHSPTPIVDPDTSPTPAVVHGPSQHEDHKSGIASESSIPTSSPISPLPSCYVVSSQYNNAWRLGLLVFLIFNLL
ncbi:mastermind-like domain-containing protein 1 isoform X1 [Cinnamomum micranthum f. kanehirae]|uniref:Mastermind-like domain-containing protein 1 isoform X1 n=1 Tax=Cinnamomum micranthum f. kanehirae TaxID=337451 RepID=A0A443NJ90_9MAGN|nr:mastermind-like domain-containing protein 1 isoform X1 [Cinnamomum micranthum f. kanehirae]